MTNKDVILIPPTFPSSFLGISVTIPDSSIEDFRLAASSTTTAAPATKLFTLRPRYPHRGGANSGALPSLDPLQDRDITHDTVYDMSEGDQDHANESESKHEVSCVIPIEREEVGAEKSHSIVSDDTASLNKSDHESDSEESVCHDDDLSDLEYDDPDHDPSVLQSDRPLIRIDLRRLAGFVPATKDEYRRLDEQVRQTLFGGSAEPEALDAEEGSWEMVASDSDDPSDSPAPSNSVGLLVDKDSCDGSGCSDSTSSLVMVQTNNETETLVACDSSNHMGPSAEESDVHEITEPSNDPVRPLDFHLQQARIFDERVEQMFTHGVAYHSSILATQEEELEHPTTGLAEEDTVNEPMQLRYVHVEYPEYLCVSPSLRSSQADTATLAADCDVEEFLLILTKDLWQAQIRRHRIHVVDRILQHLAHRCNRSLVWKAMFRQGFLSLVRQEERQRRSRSRASELHHWRTEKRTAELQRLYLIRETIHHRCAMAAQRRDDLLEHREELVKREIRIRRLAATDSIGLVPDDDFDTQEAPALGMEAFDFNSTVFAFPDEPLLGPGESLIAGYSDNEDDGYSAYKPSSDSDDDSESEIHDCNGSTIVSTGSSGLHGEGEGVVTGRDKMAQQRKLWRQRRQERILAAKEAEYRSALAEAQSAEMIVRNRLTTVELRRALAMSAALDARLNKVDEILEQLQEEEWQDEEDGIEPVARVEEAAPSEQEFSLLDEILATVLGSFPSPSTESEASHYRTLRDEHVQIVKEWKEFFGCVPYRERASTTAESKRNSPLNQSFDRLDHPDTAGNATKCWDDSSDSEPELPQVGSSGTRNDASCNRTGLRPGGRV
jgi:hypothetical protein